MEDTIRRVLELGVRHAEGMLHGQEAHLEAIKRQAGVFVSVGALQAALLGTMVGEAVTGGEQAAAAILFGGFVILLVSCINIWKPRAGFHWHATAGDIKGIRDQLTQHDEVDVWQGMIETMEGWHDQNELEHLTPLRRFLYGGYLGLAVQTLAVLIAAAF